MDDCPHTLTPGPLGGPQTNDLSWVVLRATGVLARLYAILKDYSPRTNIAARPVDTTTTKISLVILSYVRRFDHKSVCRVGMPDESGRATYRIQGIGRHWRNSSAFRRMLEKPF